jgi:UDP-N-acetylglucosamine:LPS N-acetylglucosamine transferase
MKVALVCSHGGHLTEMQELMSLVEEPEQFYITYDSPRTRDLPLDAYLLDNIGTSIPKFAKAFWRMLRIFRDERPDVVISTGSEIAIPAFIIAKLFGITTIFVESWCRVQNPSGTGKIVYWLSDKFYVQWESLLDEYGSKAEYKGSIVS